MPEQPTFVRLVVAAAKALEDRKDEVNRLNVFPVPDGDTGTNMALTMQAVISELESLAPGAGIRDICHAVTQGSLMGARGNSGVILSQILRGICEAVADATRFDTELVAAALDRSKVVAFQAVRKPVEGTMLTVLKDTAGAAKAARRTEADLDTMLDQLLSAAFESVRRTPELLPVLKENGVVDAGGFGLAILAEGLLAAYKGSAVHMSDTISTAAPSIAVEPADDWDDQEFLYCTEFLLMGDDLDRAQIEEYVSSIGGSELVVGEGDTLKIHVHTDHPGAVLAHMTGLGEVAEVHINNMRRQTEARGADLRAQASTGQDAPPRPFALITVSVGDGLTEILQSLGADAIVNGGQTMNPSTAELLEAASTIPADSVIFLPNNKNIIMAAQQAVSVSPVPAAVVPTRSIPEAFSALLAFDSSASLDENVLAMSEAASYVRTGEVTTAIKDSKAKVGPISKGQVIGITADEIEIVGDDLIDVALGLVEILADGAEALTLLAGSELPPDSLKLLEDRIAEAHPELEIESHYGGQPLYPLIIAAECRTEETPHAQSRNRL